MSTSADLRAGTTQSGTAGNTDYVELARPDGFGGYVDVMVPLSAVAQLVASAVAGLLNFYQRSPPLAPQSGLLIVPDTCTEAVVSTAGALSAVQFSTQSQGGADPPEGTRLRMWFTAGGSFRGITLQPGGVMDLEIFSGAWEVTGHT